MGYGKKTSQLHVLFDDEIKAAIETMKALYGKDFNKSEFVRDAILEKAKRDAKRLSKPKDGA